jgi:hypothetical protein
MSEALEARVPAALAIIGGTLGFASFVATPLDECLAAMK